MSRDQYLGNPNLKKGHTKSRFSKERIEEVLKCLDDPKYFISNKHEKTAFIVTTRCFKR